VKPLPCFGSRLQYGTQGAVPISWLSSRDGGRALSVRPVLGAAQLPLESIFQCLGFVSAILVLPPGSVFAFSRLHFELLRNIIKRSVTSQAV